MNKKFFSFVFFFTLIIAENFCNTSNLQFSSGNTTCWNMNGVKNGDQYFRITDSYHRKLNAAMIGLTEVQSYTLTAQPIAYINKKGRERMAKKQEIGGINFRSLYFEFSKFSGKKMLKNNNISVSQKTGV